MAQYNVRELKENLGQKISELGIDERLKENPAFEVLIGNIQNLINQSNMDNFTEQYVTISEENGRISFEYNSHENGKYSFALFKSEWPRGLHSESEVICQVTKEKSNFVKGVPYPIQEKEVIEERAVVDKFGFVTHDTNKSKLSNIPPNGIEHCMNIESKYCTESADRQIYTSDGVMIEKAFKSYVDRYFDSHVSIDKMHANAMLMGPRSVLDGGDWYSNDYDYGMKMYRDKFDTAKIKIDGKKQDCKYNAIVPLTKEQGLGNMIIPNELSEEIEIMPMSKEEIDRIIEQEPNEKVKEGLRKYAKGRENYYYNSNEDPDFRYEQSSEGRSR